MKSLFLLMMFFVTSSFSYGLERLNLVHTEFLNGGQKCVYANYQKSILVPIFIGGNRYCPLAISYDPNTGGWGL